MSAALTNLISKSDLIGVVPHFTENIPTVNFTPSNNYANSRLKGLIPDAMWTNLLLVYNAAAWSGATAYVIGNYVKIEDRVFISIQNGTNKSPLTEPTYWTEKELYSVFRDYLKPFLCWQSYAKYIAFNGLFVSQGGVKTHVSINTEDPSDTRLASAISNAQSTADTYYLNFQVYMDDIHKTIDSVVYTFTNKKTFSIKTKIGMIK
jgi:hypothetical protein